MEFTEVLLVSGKRDKARPALTWALGLYERKGMLLPLPQHETLSRGSLREADAEDALDSFERAEC